MLSCHHGRRRPVATARRAAPRRAGARLAVLLAVLGPVLGSGPARASPTRRPGSAGNEDYIQSRHGTPCQARAYWQARRYYGPLLAGVLGAD
jgi:hypothetical protein